MKKGITVLLAGLCSLTILASCQKVEEKKLDHLVVVNDANTLVYEEGEFFNIDGLRVDAYYVDGSMEENVAVETPKKELERDKQYVKLTYETRSINYPITVTYKGNNERYAVKNVERTPSEIEGKTIFFLGSSVTFGHGSLEEAFPDFLAAKDGCISIKEAVSGTSLADREEMSSGKPSYSVRLDEYLKSDNRVEKVDLFVCQLSTNDLKKPEYFGEVTANDVFDRSAFDRTTSFGALEYILSVVKETWNCPVLIYTSNNIKNEKYAQMVTTAHQVADKWDNVTILDLYNDKEFNTITKDQEILYLTDFTHPTKAGYLLWWLPKFEMTITEIIGD